MITSIWQSMIHLLLGCSTSFTIDLSENVRKTTIDLDMPNVSVYAESAGGILVADVNLDAKPDFLITTKNRIAVYGNDGSKLWVKNTDLIVGGRSEMHGLPGHNGPGLAVGDVDGDGQMEVVFPSKVGVIHIVDGLTGAPEAKVNPPHPKAVASWELVMICDLRGTGGDRDLLLQATNKEGYRMGRFLAAYSYEGLLEGQPPLWTTDNFVSCAHNGARIADLDGDGRDEVLGATILSSEGKLLAEALPFKGHMDSLFVADVRPDFDGLEVVLLEEGSNYVQVLGISGPIWREHFRNQEPQNAVVGRFQSSSSQTFIWCRSRYEEHQKPFVFDSQGEIFFDYEMDDVAPESWTTSGVEVIHTIDWTGESQQLACAKERHESGDVCLFEPLTGKFVYRISENCDRLYVADVFGDWREEIIVLNGNQLNVYENLAINTRSQQRRHWSNRNYRRLKQYHNYYSP